MAYAQELKNLVADIKTGHRDRTQYVKDVKEETARLMEGHRTWIKDNKRNVVDILGQYAKEMKEMARELKDFLAKSETARTADFKAMMQDISADIDAIRKAVGTMLADYKAERKEAARCWAFLPAREVSEEKEETIPEVAPKIKRKRRKKK